MILNFSMDSLTINLLPLPSVLYLFAKYILEVLLTKASKDNQYIVTFHENIFEKKLKKKKLLFLKKIKKSD